MLTEPTKDTVLSNSKEIFSDFNTGCYFGENSGVKYLVRTAKYESNSKSLVSFYDLNREDTEIEIPFEELQKVKYNLGKVVSGISLEKNRIFIAGTDTGFFHFYEIGVRVDETGKERLDVNNHRTYASDLTRSDIFIKTIKEFDEESFLSVETRDLLASGNRGNVIAMRRRILENSEDQGKIFF